MHAGKREAKLAGKIFLYINIIDMYFISELPALKQELVCQEKNSKNYRGGLNGPEGNFTN